MRSTTFVIAGLAAAIASLAPSSARAQGRATPQAATMFEVSPYAGYLFAGSMLSGPLGSSVGPSPAPLVGTQLAMRIAPNVSVVGNLATGSSDMTAGIQYLGGVSVAQSRVVLYDAGLQLDLPMASATGASFSPFIQAGVGGMRYDMTESFLSSSSTSLAGNVGVGADVSVGSGVGIRLMAKDYISQFDPSQLTSALGSVNTSATQNYALSIGMRFSF